jgi:hypothetical protein
MDRELLGFDAVSKLGQFRSVRSRPLVGPIEAYVPVYGRLGLGPNLFRRSCPRSGVSSPGFGKGSVNPSIAVMTAVVGFRNSFSTSIGGR